VREVDRSWGQEAVRDSSEQREAALVVMVDGNSSIKTTKQERERGEASGVS